MNNIAGWLVPTIIGSILPLLVMTGIHHGLTAAGINNRMTIGFDTMIYPGQLASNVAQGAAALSVLLILRKDNKMKGIASASGISALLG